MVEISKEQFLKLENVDKARILKWIAMGIARYKESDKQMNKNIKRTVYKILQEDKYAREDDWYLIQQVLIQMLPCDAGTMFCKVLQGMKVQGISFEAITRARRKVMEENPELKEPKAEHARREEEEKYHFEFSGRKRC